MDKLMSEKKKLSDQIADHEVRNALYILAGRIEDLELQIASLEKHNVKISADIHSKLFKIASDIYKAHLKIKQNKSVYVDVSCKEEHDIIDESLINFSKLLQKYGGK